MNQIKPMNQFISVLQILTILIQHKQLNNGSYSLYFDSKILSHYPIHKLKDMADKPTNFDTIHTSNTNCAIMYLMKKHGREAYKFGYHQYSSRSFIMNQIKPMNQNLSQHYKFR